MIHRITHTIGGKEITLETGLLGKQASGAVVASCGGTKVFAAATCNLDSDSDKGFFPLYVDYREMTYASGKIPGSFFRREGRPTEREILICRLIDRPVRPQFPKGFMKEVSIHLLAISFDKENDSDILAQIAAGAALAISEIPMTGIVGSARVGKVNGELTFNPLRSEMKDSQIDLIVSGTSEGLCMVEAGAKEATEQEMLDALNFGEKCIKDVIAQINELVSVAGKEKVDFTPPEPSSISEELAGKYRQRIIEAGTVPIKDERRKALATLRKEVIAEYTPEEDDKDALDIKEVKNAYEQLEHDALREKTLSGVRCDGRKLDEIRPISIVMDYLPGAHGSAVFTRGETQSLTTCTLGTSMDALLIDGIIETYNDPFLLHYNFPSYSVGETWPNRGPKRREIGHGVLAKRSLRYLRPAEEDFPYVIRLVSDIMESNGSSSMATVCGGSLAMMAAGVPVKEPVAGIAMGLIRHEGEYTVLSDILGDEDHFGDMDFKVAGTRTGITALQMDIKITGIPTDVMARALEQAREGRLHILGKMTEVMPAPREELPENAPRIHMLMIPVDLIGKVIGPGGKSIRNIQDVSGAKLEIEDDGKVIISAVGGEKLKKAIEMVEDICFVPEIGQILEGPVVSVRDFGCFVKIGTDTEGMCHISELSTGYVQDIYSVVRQGDNLMVKVINIDHDGKIRLSRKQALLDRDLPDPMEELLKDQDSSARPPRRESSRPREKRFGSNDRGDRRGRR